MAITLELKPHIQAQVLIQAEASGLPVDRYLEKLIESHMKTFFQATRTPNQTRERLMQIAKEWHALPTLDGRAPDEIIGYDELGLPKS